MEGEREPTLVEHYAGVLRRRKWALLLPLVIVPVLALGNDLRQPPTYDATAEVLLREPTLANAVAGVAPAELSDRDLATQASLARLPDVVRATLRRVPQAGLDVDGLLAHSSVTNPAGSALVVFDVRTHDAALSRALAASYASSYARFRERLDEQALAAARADIDRQLRADARKNDPVSRALSAGLVQRRQQLATLAAFTSTSSDVVRSPLEAVKVGPRPVRALGLGLALALVLGCGLALLLEEFDTRVRSAESASRGLDLPVLARLPAPLGAAPTAPEAGSTAYAEAIRMLRANVELASPRETLGTVLVTSGVGGEGKTTTAAHLAVALARAGHRVAVCDVDARRPSLHTLFGVADGPGLGEVARGTASLSSALVEVPVSAAPGERRRSPRREGKLFVLPFGYERNELALSSALGRIVPALRRRADVVVLDAPPLLLSGDAVAATRSADALVLVTNVRLARRSVFPELRRLLAATPAAKLGVVVTGVSADDLYGYAEPRESGRPLRVAEPPEAPADTTGSLTGS